MKKFSSLLTQYREWRGLSKTELANKIGVTVSYIIDLEKGRKKPPTFQRCEKISQVLELEENDKKDFFKVAFEERSGTRGEKLFKDLIGSLDDQLERVKGLQDRLKISHIPLISWVHAGKFTDINDSFPVGMAEEYIYTSTKGKNMFALRVDSDSMIPEFNAGDIIIIKPNSDIVNGDYIVVADRSNNTATFKQYRVYGDKIILHPLNPKYQDIELDSDPKYIVVGKVVEKVKKY